MDYQVSSKVEKAFSEVLAMPEVKKALEFIEKDQEQSIKEQIELTLIEAPTFHEENRTSMVRTESSASIICIPPPSFLKL